MMNDFSGYRNIKRRHAENSDSGIRPFDALDFTDIVPRLQAAALIKNILGLAAMSVVYGDSTAGKTFLALDCALHVAAGQDWFGYRVRKAGTLYLAGEGARGVENRVAAFKKYYGITEAVPFALVSAQADLRSDNTDTARIVATIEAAAARFQHPVWLVIVDTLTRALAGGNDSDPEHMGAYVRNVDAIRVATQAHVMSIHHTGKDATRGARGHSSLRAATDTEIEVTRDEDTGISTARITKQRDLASDGTSILYRLERVGLGYDEDGDEITSCVVQVADGAGSKSRKAKQPNAMARQALKTLNDCVARSPIMPMTVSEHIPAGASGVTKATWRANLEKGGIINADGNPREQLRRVIVTLKEAGLLGVWEDFVWPVTNRHSASQ